MCVLAVVLASPGPQSANCEPRPRPDNGQAIFTSSKNWMRAVEVYQCDSGYVMTGQTKHTCVGGEWSGDVPSCARHTGELADRIGPTCILRITIASHMILSSAGVIETSLDRTDRKQNKKPAGVDILEYLSTLFKKRYPYTHARIL